MPRVLAAFTGFWPTVHRDQSTINSLRVQVQPPLKPLIYLCRREKLPGGCCSMLGRGARELKSPEQDESLGGEHIPIAGRRHREARGVRATKTYLCRSRSSLPGVAGGLRPSPRHDAATKARNNNKEKQRCIIDCPRTSPSSGGCIAPTSATARLQNRVLLFVFIFSLFPVFFFNPPGL